jgi:D-lyxose ketol-isomerase
MIPKISLSYSHGYEPCYKDIVLLSLVLLFSLKSFGQNYPTSEHVPNINWETWSPPTNVPGYLQPFNDPITGNKVTRISDESVFGCDCNKLRHRYSKNQPWNADGTKIMTDGWPAKILDGETYEFIANVNCRAIWSNVDPDMTYDIGAGGALVRRNIVTQTEETLHVFSGYTEVSIGLGEGNLSNDDRWVALNVRVGSNKSVLVYDIWNDVITGSKNFGTTSIDWASVSQSGSFVVVQFDSNGSGTNQGVKSYNQQMQNEVHLQNNTEHSDIGYDMAGNEVYISHADYGNYSLSYTRLDNGVTNGVFYHTGAPGDKGMSGGHISARNLNRPGWAYVYDQGWYNQENNYEACKQIFAIKLDNSDTIQRFGLQNSNYEEASNGYNHQAQAVPNRDGTKVLFASNWDVAAWKQNSFPMMFVVEVEQTAGSQVTVNSDATNNTICEGDEVILTAANADSYAWDFNGETTETITVSPDVTTTYTVTGTHSDGSTTEAEITITVNEIPLANAGQDIATCQGTPVTLTASGGTSYSWNTNETSPTITVNPDVTTTYSVVVTQNNCSSTDTVTVTVNAIPNVDAGDDVTMFIGDSATLTATGADSYEWSTGETTQSITVNPVLDTSYSVTGTTNGCENSDTITVFLQDDSVNANAGNDTEICNGETTTLTATGGTTYLWSTGETTASISVSPNTTTTYTVTVFSISGANQEDDSVVVTVNDLPAADAGTGAEICSGNATTLTASGGSSYLWSTGETTQTITVAPTNTTTYTVEVFENNCSDSDTVTVTVNPLPNVNAGDDATIVQGDSATLTATGADSYLWSTGETTSSITVTPDTTTLFTVTGTSNNGCEADDSVTVTVQSETVNANAGADVSICNGESTTLIATGGVTYLWNTGETTASIDVSPNSTTTYTVTAFSASGNTSDEDSVTVTVNEIPVTDAGADVTISEGESTTLTATGADTYLWNSGETTQSITVTPGSSTTYTVTGFSNNCESSDQVTVIVETINVTANAGTDVTICNGESTTLTATGGTTYLWNTGQTTASITVNPNTTTTYIVTVFNTAQTSSDDDSVTVTVNESPTTDAGADVTISEGESTTLTATGADTYLWNTGETAQSITVSPSSSVTYTVTGFSNNCEASDQVTVTVEIENVIANAGTDTAICIGESTTLTASGGTTYLWNTGETTASITVNPNTTTTYTVTAFNAAETSSDNDSVIVTVNELPSTNAGNDETIFLGNTTILTATGADTYLWSTGETTATIEVSPNETTNYNVTGFSNGCEFTDEVEISVIFEASAGANQTICQGYSTTLTASEGDAYLWSTGETTQSINVNPTGTQTYTVTVYAGVYEDDADVTVSVNPNPNVVITNGGEVMILEGEFVTLSASGANSYLWNNGATQPNIAVSPSATTTYEVTGFINDCEDTSAIVVNVVEAVVADAGEDLIICSEETVTLTANGGDEYLWNTGETTQSIEVSPDTDTEYSVLVYNALDSDEDTIMVFVEACNTIENFPEDSDEFGFIVYQDPLEDVLKVKVNGLQSVAAKGISIYDITGKILYTELFNASQLENQSEMTRSINTSAYARGIYMVRLIYDDTSVLKKIPIR